MCDRDRWVGLNEWALALVTEEFYVGEHMDILFRTDGAGRVRSEGSVFESLTNVEQYETFRTLCGQDYPLCKHTLPDGRVFYEKLQLETNSPLQDPQIFIALQDEQGNWIPESMWQEDEVAVR